MIHNWPASAALWWALAQLEPELVLSERKLWFPNVEVHLFLHYSLDRGSKMTDGDSTQEPQQSWLQLGYEEGYG